MRAIRFRVENYRNIDDSGWIALEKVTAFVGRNESGKTSLLKALHKFMPATNEEYDAQREFPRDRYTRDYVANGAKGSDWPVCSVEFEIAGEVRNAIDGLLDDCVQPPTSVTVTRFYDGSMRYTYTPEVTDTPLRSAPVLEALDSFASKARRLRATEVAAKEEIAELRKELLQFTNYRRDQLKRIEDLRSDVGVEMLNELRSEVDERSSAETANAAEALQSVIEPILDEATRSPSVQRINNVIREALPVFIYFENYGILDSAVWLPRFIDDLDRDSSNPRVRTINAMFAHVGLDAREIARLGEGEARSIREEGTEPTPEQITADQRRVEVRAIKLNSASNDISKRFSDWWRQRRHKIRYHADGDYFRIWIADDRRPDVEIELESRSKGFQWFFSFYLVFIVESDEGHRDAILLLDEPGLHLHPTAQQELISFFEKLSETNQIAYTTHSPFLIDGQNLHRVRPVTEDSTGHSRITAETWPSDRETIFPLQAAAGYAMIRGLFRHRKNVLVEGMSDFYYLHALSHRCERSGRKGLPDDIYITPCGGTKLVGHFASLFLGHEVRPVILLDGDDAARVRRNALVKELYVNHGSMIVMLDEVLEQSGEEVEIEDVLGEDLILSSLAEVLGHEFELSDDDSEAGSLSSRVKSAARRRKVELPQGWKASVALHVVSSWAEGAIVLSDTVLDRAGSVFSALRVGFDGESR